MSASTSSISRCPRPAASCCSSDGLVSTAVTFRPASASGRACRPGPQPRSRTVAGGSPSSSSSCWTSCRPRAKVSALNISEPKLRQKLSSRYHSSLKFLLLLLWLPGLAGCATMAWYGQAARGQIEVLTKREDIAQLLADPATPPALAERLRTVLDIRDFATRELGLPDSGSY